MWNLFLRGVVPLCTVALAASVQAPTAYVGAVGLAVHVVVAPNPVVRQRRATITAATRPGSQCRARVLYEATDHYATSRSLRIVRIADRAGHAVWSWASETKRSGPAVATVECTRNGLSVVGVARFTVH